MAEEAAQSTCQQKTPKQQLKYSSVIVLPSSDKFATPCQEQSCTSSVKLACSELRSSDKKKNCGTKRQVQEVSNFLSVTRGQIEHQYATSENNEEDNCSGYQSTDFQTAYENRSSFNQLDLSKSNKAGDSISENEAD